MKTISSLERNRIYFLSILSTFFIIILIINFFIPLSSSSPTRSINVGFSNQYLNLLVLIYFILLLKHILNNVYAIEASEQEITFDMGLWRSKSVPYQKINEIKKSKIVPVINFILQNEKIIVSSKFENIREIINITKQNNPNIKLTGV